jgi:hypothetical protein
VFRTTGITAAYLEAGGTLEKAQAMAAHESPRTTKLYDRTGDEITHSMKLRRSKSNLAIPTADVVIFSSGAFARPGTRCQTRF